MTICAVFDGRRIEDCTRGEGCICLKEQQQLTRAKSLFPTIYAERYGDQSKGEPYIAERGVFYSIAEFAPWRSLGWSSTTEHNKQADDYLFALGAQEFANAIK